MIKGRDKSIFLGKPLQDLRDRIHEINNYKLFDIRIEGSYTSHNSSGIVEITYESQRDNSDVTFRVKTNVHTDIDEATLDLLERLKVAYAK